MKKEKFTKAKETKKKILDVSLKLFLEQGYEKATMRSIAKLAGLTPGATYYHFPTKEYIVFHFYQQAHEQQIPKVAEVLKAESTLRARVAGAIRAHLDVARPYHSVSKVLFKNASDPSNALSPFSAESKPLRDKDIDSFRQVVEGSTDRIPKNLQDRLPELLWLYKIFIIIYWIHDTSPELRKTNDLVDKGTALIVRLIGMANLPFVKSFVNQLVGLIDEFKPY